jgi:hypothetical protein
MVSMFRQWRGLRTKNQEKELERTLAVVSVRRGNGQGYSHCTNSERTQKEGWQRSVCVANGELHLPKVQK